MSTVIAVNKFKTGLIMMLTVAFVAIVAYAIGQVSNMGRSALPLAIAIAVGSSLMSYFASHKIVLSVSGARKAQPNEDRRIRPILTRLCNNAELPVPSVYVTDDPSPNAFATGRNHNNAVVCCTTGLLSAMSDRELEGVLAHELAHIKNYDILLQTIATVVVGIAIILSNFWTRSLFWGGGMSSRRSSKDENNAGQAILVVIGVIFIILAPIAGQLLKMTLSRNREYLADATGAEISGNPNGLADALLRLSNSPGSARASNATENLYIVNPLRAKATGGFGNIFSTHPPIEKRVEALRKMA